MSSKAFDARETYMCEDQSASRDRWRTVSLVMAIRSLVSHDRDSRDADPKARLEAFRAAANELTRRGIDADSLVRFGLQKEIITQIGASLLVRRLVPLSPGEATGGIDLAKWGQVLGVPMDPPEKLTTGMAVKIIEDTLPLVIGSLAAWVRFAPVEMLVTRVPPDQDALREARASNPEGRELSDQYRWLVDRFSTTFLADWSVESLHHEYRSQHDLQPAICPAELMSDREVPTAELQAEIARRAVLEPVGPEDLERSSFPLAPEMENHARTLLRQGRYREAAALFEFAVQQKPKDPRAHNDLGFCLVPVDPTEALFYLENAAKMGYLPKVINVVNRMCCHIALGEGRRGLSIAEEYWDGAAERRIEPATLWVPREGGGWELSSEPDAFRALAVLAAHAARVEGRKEDEENWVHRGRTP